MNCLKFLVNMCAVVVVVVVVIFFFFYWSNSCVRPGVLALRQLRHWQYIAD